MNKIELVKRIINNNQDIFNKTHSIKEINSGFNNDIFNVDNKYIIKICTNKNLEEKFDKEANFYTHNYSFIPKLYKYDNSKKIIPYAYEIIQNINGKSLYYHWYKMNETEREKTIKEIVAILKIFHQEEKPYNWTSYIKNEINKYYQQVKNKFTSHQQQLIEKAFNKYDKYLKTDKFVKIHNDLHFDNILVGNKLYLIDFNDIMIAPIDYDLRIFYMCKEKPWKWADETMDPYQKKEDYQNIDKYLKKYYEELNNIKYLNERMIIYQILNDIELLTRFNEQELIDNVINCSQKLLMI